MMTTLAYALRSPIHSLLVAELMNSGRDAIVLVVAEVKSTSPLLQHLYHLQISRHDDDDDDNDDEYGDNAYDVDDDDNLDGDVKIVG